MHYSFRHLSFVLASTLLITFSVEASGAVFDATVKVVATGDTIHIHADDGDMEVHILGIDAPELQQEFGLEARSALSHLLLNKEVLVRTSEEVGSEEGEATRRAQVALHDTDIGLFMLERGFAWTQKGTLNALPEAWRDAYVSAELRAKEEERGLWQSLRPVPPWTWRKMKRDQEREKLDAEEAEKLQSLSSVTKEFEAKFDALRDAIDAGEAMNPAQNTQRDFVEKKKTWWQIFSDFGEVLSRWIVALFKSFI